MTTSPIITTDSGNFSSIEALLDFHRKTFGSAVMEDEGTPPPEGDGEGANDEEPTDPPPGDEEPPGEPKTYTEDYVKELRAEAANYRVKYREAQEALKAAKTPEEYEAAITSFQGQIDALERQVRVRDLVQTHELPKDLAEVLSDLAEKIDGDALEAHAKRLAKFASPEPTRLSGGLDPDDGDDDPGTDPAEYQKRYKRR